MKIEEIAVGLQLILGNGEIHEAVLSGEDAVDVITGALGKQLKLENYPGNGVIHYGANGFMKISHSSPHTEGTKPDFIDNAYESPEKSMDTYQEVDKLILIQILTHITAFEISPGQSFDDFANHYPYLKLLGNKEESAKSEIKKIEDEGWIGAWIDHASSLAHTGDVKYGQVQKDLSFDAGKVRASMHFIIREV
jgi:hypothetical protein